MKPTLFWNQQVELLLRSHVAYAIAHEHGPYRQYLREDFYSDAPRHETTMESCLRDISRSKDRHILRYHGGDEQRALKELPIWSAVEALSFGTLSKMIERGAQGKLSGAVASSIGAAKAGFAYRVRALVYLRNRCAHQARLWHHSVIDAGPTPNNVRCKAKRLSVSLKRVPSWTSLHRSMIFSPGVVRGNRCCRQLPSSTHGGARTSMGSRIRRRRRTTLRDGLLKLGNA